MIVSKLLVDKLVQTIFAAFLVVLIVGFNPFESSDSIRELSAEGSGNASRQITFVMFFIFSVAIGFLSQINLKIIIENKLVFLLVSISVLSTVWSADPSITFRRAMLLFLVVYTFLAFAYYIGFELAFEIIYKTLLLLIVISVILSIIYPDARHLSNDVYDDSLINSWRGLFGHKNEASSLACLFIIISITKLKDHKSLAWRLGIVSSIILLLYSGSKTCLLVLPISLILGFIFSKYRLSLRLTMSWLFFLPIIFLLGDFIYGLLFSNPELFTGRGAIWSVLIEAIWDSPVLGHGYGILWNAGDITPLGNFGVNTVSWVNFVSHGHNGYLDVIASIGVVGFLILVLIFLQASNGIERFPPALKYSFYSFYVFFLFHNFLESSFLMSDKFNWLFFVFIISWGTKHVQKTKV